MKHLEQERSLHVLRTSQPFTDRWMKPCDTEQTGFANVAMYVRADRPG